MSTVLRRFGSLTPDIPYVRAIPNRILKPLHKLLGLGGGIVPVLDFRMRLDPDECVDGNLWFAPHLYDRKEITFFLRRFPDRGVFVDVGANIGFWSLRFSAAFPQSRIYAIEANPDTFQVLCENIQVNDFQNITPVHIGVSNEFGVLPLYCNDTGNRGGDSFDNAASGRNRHVKVRVNPLTSILADVGIDRVDLLKIDIEGLEELVLSNFFSEAPDRLWPRYICAEISHVPEVVVLLEKNRYRLILSTRENGIFSLVQDQA